jgi:membrane associated rhomboid family serine protease
MSQFISKIQINSPVIIGLFIVSLIALILNALTHGGANRLLFSTYRSSIFDPLTYIRAFTHILGHSNWTHFMNNFLYILLVGPMIEEKYGSTNLLFMVLITAVITAIINTIISRNALLGASGVVFMLIIMGSFVNIQSGKIPITLVLVFIFYIINEVISGIFNKDNVSHLSHLIGAICGLIYGFYFF